MNTYRFKKPYYERLINMPMRNLGYYLAGFVDGEGCFSISLSYHKTARYGFFVNPIFQVYQHPHHREILEIFQWVFKTGKIRRKSPTNHGLVYCVDGNRNIIEKVIPFFEKFPLAVKSNEFLKFKKITEFLLEKKHHTKEGMIEIINIAYSMNMQGKQRARLKSDLIKIVESNNNLTLQKPSETTRQTSIDKLMKI